MALSLFRLVRHGTGPVLGVALLLAAGPSQGDTAKAEPHAGRTSLAAAVVPKAAVPTRPRGLFGTREVRSSNLNPFKKWTGVLKRYRGERQLETQPCDGRACPLQHWRDFVASLKGRDTRYQINAVNRYVNQVRYIPDQLNSGKSDYWATPREFFGRGGDCEEFAIAKYLSLRALGFDANAMRLVVLQDLNLGIAHAVLVVEHEGKKLVLDNQLRIVVPAEKITHYRPYYSINESHWWLHKTPGRAKPEPTVVAQRSAK
jgi:predicted transglutaminase-like cysteine proteinase